MKVAGVTFIRNAIKYDYPIIEAITSILPICDEFIVLVGNSEDDTLQIVQSIQSSKIKIYHSIWDDRLREGGKVLADETNKALDLVSKDTTWCFYLQSDECVHEKYLPIIKDAMEKHQFNTNVDGLLFNYVHFYGNYNYYGNSPLWYFQEIRIVRNDSAIRSYQDAQGFRKRDNKKLNVKLIAAEIFHYGWVKPPLKQQAKQFAFHKLWHNDDWLNQNIHQTEVYDYSNIDSVKPFTETHPEVYQQRILNTSWTFDGSQIKNQLSLRYKLKMLIIWVTRGQLGVRKNFKKV